MPKPKPKPTPIHLESKRPVARARLLNQEPVQRARQHAHVGERPRGEHYLVAVEAVARPVRGQVAERLQDGAHVFARELPRNNSLLPREPQGLRHSVGRARASEWSREREGGNGGR